MPDRTYSLVDHREAYLAWRKFKNWTKVREAYPELPSKPTLSKWSRDFDCPYHGCVWHEYMLLERLLNRAKDRIIDLTKLMPSERIKIFKEIAGVDIMPTVQDVDSVELAVYEALSKEKKITVSTMMAGKEKSIEKADELTMRDLRGVVVDIVTQIHDIDLMWRIVMQHVTNIEDKKLNSYLANKGHPYLNEPLYFKTMGEAIKSAETLVKMKLLLEGRPTEIQAIDIVDTSELPVEAMQKLIDVIDHVKKGDTGSAERILEQVSRYQAIDITPEK